MKGKLDEFDKSGSIVKLKLLKINKRLNILLINCRSIVRIEQLY